MIGDNIKNLRQKKWMTQEELAIRLCVVRQTVSKWEKNLSVPDAQMVIKLAEVFEVSVSSLLGLEGGIEGDEENSVSLQLMRINEQLAIKNKRASLIWRVIIYILIGIIIFNILMVIINMVSFKEYEYTEDYRVEISSEEENLPLSYISG